MTKAPQQRAVINLARGVLISAFWASFVNPANAQIFTHDRSVKALTHLQSGLSAEQEELFFLGRSFANVPWVEAPAATTARDGLGPLFNANTCVACHTKNGAGGGYGPQGEAPRSSVVQLHKYDSQQQIWGSDPVYGPQISVNGNRDVPFEGAYHIVWQAAAHDSRLRYPTPTFSQLNYGPLHTDTHTQLMRAPALTGLGLLEQIPDAQIYAQADPQDSNGDGISGRTQMVWSYATQSQKLGRFGWKNTTASVIDQSAKAAHLDMGLSNPLFTEENCTPTQTECNQAFRSETLDLPAQRLQAIAIYLSNLKIPKPDGKHTQGKVVFNQLGCQNCHSNTYTLSNGQALPAYTDLLLHDMGEALQSKGPLAREWRTAPLWGLGLNQHQQPPAYLHDGRAKNLTEAILWHDGEAQSSREAFNLLPLAKQQQLLAFLGSL
ncbi:MAG: di-heme oxidoredictase family protein [Gammaproteobacteria bacterium]|nr:di-heme oxidoredictase family protein [Gammaproteobacteria bacterium]